MKSRACTTAAATLAFGSLALAEAPARPTPVIQVGVDVVRIDATVTDRNGRPVTDLRPEDFRLEIDGKPVLVENAAFFGRTTADGVLPEIADDAARARPAERSIVFLIDDLNLGQSSAYWAAPGAPDLRLTPGVGGGDDRRAVHQRRKRQGASVSQPCALRRRHRGLPLQPEKRQGVRSLAFPAADLQPPHDHQRAAIGARPQDRDPGDRRTLGRIDARQPPPALDRLPLRLAVRGQEHRRRAAHDHRDREPCVHGDPHDLSERYADSLADRVR